MVFISSRHKCFILCWFHFCVIDIYVVSLKSEHLCIVCNHIAAVVISVGSFCVNAFVFL